MPETSTVSLGWRHRVGGADAEDLAVLDGDGGIDHGVGRDDLAAGEDEIGAS